MRSMPRVRLLTAVLTVACLAPACHRAKDATGVGADSGSAITRPGGADASGGGTGGGDGAGANGNGQPTTTGPKGKTGTTARPATGGTTPGGGGNNTTVPPAPPDSGARAGVGAFARTVLRPASSSKVVIEVFQQSGAGPTARSLDHAAAVLRQVTGKQVAVSGPVDLPGTGSDVNEAQIRDLADRYSRSTQGNGQAVIHVLFLNGRFKGDDSILGISVRGDTAAVMSEQVRSASTPIAPRSTIEDAVTEHELGHLLGLVDLARNTGRADPDHPGHSTNRNSVMYWAVESDLVSQVLGGPPPVDFDSADMADLAALRNGA
ncbi:MAG: hypothetical protein QOK43_442 [Acidimicrobiaceae bacterium]|nr:hypothetical protein [Acidimicrobiaceae bacterium]